MSTHETSVATFGQAFLMDIDEVHENTDNPRYITKKDFSDLCQSITDDEQMMYVRPVVIDENNVALGGNMRLKACRHLGWAEIPVVRVTGWTEQQKRAFIIKDNLNKGSWDWDILANSWDMEQINDWGLTAPDMTEAESSPIPKKAKDEPIEDDGYEPPKVLPQTYLKTGDLIEIGAHRLCVGDATRESDVRRLFGAARPRIMVTDPPYGVQYDAAWRNDRLGEGKRATGRVENDHSASWQEAYKLFPGDIAYIWHASLHTATVFEDVQSSGFDIIAQIIWNKQHFAISRGDYHWKHEPCWYAVRKGQTHGWQGARDQSTVWDIQNALRSGEEKTGHSTQKPIECMARPIRNNSTAGDAVYDPFGGSGSAMVAAQELGRVAFVMEILPEYCQMIVDRMKLRYPDLDILINGLPFEP